jgi:hypothetical protein
LLHPRYEKQELQQDFQNDRYSTVNGGLLSDFSEVESDEILEKRSKFVLIGGLLINE